jgi:hypothetical protein
LHVVPITRDFADGSFTPGAAFNQRSNQAQERLMLGISLASTENTPMSISLR